MTQPEDGFPADRGANNNGSNDTELGMAEVITFPGVRKLGGATRSSGAAASEDPAASRETLNELRERIAATAAEYAPRGPAETRQEPAALQRNNVSALPGVGGDAQDLEAASTALVRALTRSQKSVREAERFLADTTELEVRDRAQIIERMLELGYLDDLRLAQQLVAGAFARKGLGEVAMRRELQQRGVDPVQIDEALAELNHDDEYERALELAQQRASRLRDLDSETARRRLYGYMARRGYTGDIVGRVVREALG